MRCELSKTTTFLAAALLSLAACAGDAEVQRISGKITLSSFRAPVEGVRAMQGTTVIATGRVAADGSFSLAVPAGADYRLEVVTREAPYDLLVSGKNGTPRVAAFDVCAGEDPFDMGGIDYWDEEDGGALPCPPDVPPEECGEPTEPCDPAVDPDCPSDPCAEDPEACLPPECPPDDPGCLPPEPCDPSTDPDCPPDPCLENPELCWPPECPEGTDPETCWPDDPGCPYDDPACWPEPLPPPECDDPSNPDCGADSGDGAVPENPLPDFGC